MLCLKTKVLESVCTEYNGNIVGWIGAMGLSTPSVLSSVLNLAQFCPLILQPFTECDSSMSKCCHLNSSNQKRPLDYVFLHSPRLVLNGRLHIFAFSLDCTM